MCRADWRRHLGGAFPAFERFLEELPGTVAETFPDPDSGLPMTPRRADDGTFTAYSPDPDETRVGPVEGIPAQDLTRHRIRWAELGPALAKAIRAAPHDAPGPLDTLWVREIGVCSTAEQERTALLLVTGYATEALGWLRHLLTGGCRLFVLPVHDPLIESLAVQHDQHYFALDRDMRVQRVGSRWGFAAAHQPKSAAATAAKPAPARLRVIFSDGFKTAYRDGWAKPETRARGRQAHHIMRALFENWRDKSNRPMPINSLLPGVTIDRLDKAMSSKAYPSTWSLIRQHTDERTGLTAAWLAAEFDYESR